MNVLRAPGTLVDFHCHLDLYPDHAAAVANAEREAVFTLAVTTTPKAWPRNRELSLPTSHIRASLGLHPQLVAERAIEIALWEEYLPQARFVGEVGLDGGARFYRSIALQRNVFERVLRCCEKAGGRILSVHSVRAVTGVLDLIEANLSASQGKVVLHWFTGSRAEARRAVDLGCYFSINIEMLKSERGRDLVAALPQDRLLTETDGPFTCTRGRPAQPVDVKAAIEGLGLARKIPATEVMSIVRANLQTLLDFADTADTE